jgi:16S rRNA (uracil1498-N3)-methyltransferase
VMRIEPVSKIEAALATPALTGLICLTTERSGEPLTAFPVLLQDADAVTLLIGPEGGWTGSELQTFEQAGVEFARLTETILRTETAAVAAAAIAVMMFN